MAKGKYDQLLTKMLSMYSTHRKTYDMHKSKFEKTVDAANAFSSAYTKAAAKMGTDMTKMMDSNEECATIVAELSVYEADLAQAEKKKDKKKIDAAKKKMKPLIQKLEGAGKQNKQLTQAWNKDKEGLVKLMSAIASAGA